MRLRPRAQAHPWVCVLHAAPNSRLNAVVVERLVAFTRSSRLERALLNLVAKHLSRADIGHLEAMFKALDTDGDGRAARGDPPPPAPGSISQPAAAPAAPHAPSVVPRMRGRHECAGVRRAGGSAGLENRRAGGASRSGGAASGGPA